MRDWRADPDGGVAMRAELLAEILLRDEHRGRPVATAFFFYSVGRARGSRRRAGNHAQESGAFGAGADCDAAGSGWALPDAVCAICRWRADHSLRGRNHGAVLFVIMLVNIERTQKEEQFNKQWLVGIAAPRRAGWIVHCGLHDEGQGTCFRKVDDVCRKEMNTQRVAALL